MRKSVYESRLITSSKYNQGFGNPCPSSDHPNDSEGSKSIMTTNTIESTEIIKKKFDFNPYPLKAALYDFSLDKSKVTNERSIISSKNSTKMNDLAKRNNLQNIEIDRGQIYLHGNRHIVANLTNLNLVPVLEQRQYRTIKLSLSQFKKL